MPALRDLFLQAGFESPTFKVAAAPGYMMDFGVVHVASRLLDFETKELLKDNSRFRLPDPMETGDRFEGDIPISVGRPGKYWLKLDLVAELVCCFESVGSEPILIEVNVTP